MHVTTSLPPSLQQDRHDLYTPPDTAPWLTILQPPQHKIHCNQGLDEDTDPKPVQGRADSTSARQEDASTALTSGKSDAASASGGSTSGGVAAASSRRTVFTRLQLSELEARFREQTFLSKEERVQMADDLKLTERQIMIWFQNRRGRLKRRGPSDNAYTADKLKELNTRRPYPFLYGLLSSMQYKYPEGHQHPYQHLVAEKPHNVNPNPAHFNTTPRHNGGPTPPFNPTAPFMTSHTPNVSNVPAVNVTIAHATPTSTTSEDAMPPNVDIHQMSWSAQRRPTTSVGSYMTSTSGSMDQSGYHQPWMASRAGPIRYTHPAASYHHNVAPYQQPGWSGQPAGMSTYQHHQHDPTMLGHHPATAEQHAVSGAAPPACPLQTHKPYTSHNIGQQGHTTTPPRLLPTSMAHTSPVSSAGSSSPEAGGPQTGVDVLSRCDLEVNGLQQLQCSSSSSNSTNNSSSYSSHASSPQCASSSLSSSVHGHYYHQYNNSDFNPQIDHVGFVPDFPDITSSLFPYTSQTTC